VAFDVTQDKVAYGRSVQFTAGGPASEIERAPKARFGQPSYIATSVPGNILKWVGSGSDGTPVQIDATIATVTGPAIQLKVAMHPWSNPLTGHTNAAPAEAAPKL
jgi:hypothetical protein